MAQQRDNVSNSERQTPNSLHGRSSGPSLSSVSTTTSPNANVTHHGGTATGDLEQGASGQRHDVRGGRVMVTVRESKHS